MKTIVILRPREGVGFDDFQPHLIAEEKTLWSHLQDGTCRSIHYAADCPGTIVLEFETRAPEEVRPLVDRFPIVEADLFDVETLPLAPYAGLAALFAPEHGIAPELPPAWR